MADTTLAPRHHDSDWHFEAPEDTTWEAFPASEDVGDQMLERLYECRRQAYRELAES